MRKSEREGTPLPAFPPDEKVQPVSQGRPAQSLSSPHANPNQDTSSIGLRVPLSLPSAPQSSLSFPPSSLLRFLVFCSVRSPSLLLSHPNPVFSLPSQSTKVPKYRSTFPSLLLARPRTPGPFLPQLPPAATPLLSPPRIRLARLPPLLLRGPGTQIIQETESPCSIPLVTLPIHPLPRPPLNFPPISTLFLSSFPLSSSHLSNPLSSQLQSNHQTKHPPEALSTIVTSLIHQNEY